MPEHVTPPVPLPAASRGTEATGGPGASRGARAGSGTGAGPCAWPVASAAYPPGPPAAPPPLAAPPAQAVATARATAVAAMAPAATLVAPVPLRVADEPEPGAALPLADRREPVRHCLGTFAGQRG